MSVRSGAVSRCVGQWDGFISVQKKIMNGANKETRKKSAYDNVTYFELGDAACNLYFILKDIISIILCFGR